MRSASYRVAASFLILILSIGDPPHARAYSLLTHELLVDLIWHNDVVPLLKARYPDMCKDADKCESTLREARAFAIGGALIQDSGYYHKPEQSFADYTHYIRTGDFVSNLFRNATEPDELAFAIGALTHYVGDTVGHSEATNPSVAKVFSAIAPGTESVTYAQNQDAHYAVEFGFDINGAHQNRFAPLRLSKSHGMDVALRQLTLAYYQTYGVDEDLTYKKAKLDLGAYRGRGRTMMPAGAFTLAKNTEKTPPDHEDQTPELAEFLRLVNQVAAEDGWADYGAGAGVSGIMAKAYFHTKGGKKLTRIDLPTAVTQQKYVASVVHAKRQLDDLLNQMLLDARLSVPVLQAAGVDSTLHPLPNVNLDTGLSGSVQAYTLTDIAYFHLLRDILSDAKIDASYGDPSLEWKPPPSVTAEITAYFGQKRAFTTPDDDPSTVAHLPDRIADLNKLKTTTGCPRTNFGDADVGMHHWLQPGTKTPCTTLPLQP